MGYSSRRRTLGIGDNTQKMDDNAGIPTNISLMRYMNIANKTIYTCVTFLSKMASWRHANILNKLLICPSEALLLRLSRLARGVEITYNN